MELKNRVPNAYRLLDDTSRAILAPCVVLTKLKIDLPDYSAMVFPALRGLEAYIKCLLVKHGIVVTIGGGVSSHFNRGSLLPGNQAKIACKHTISAIEDSFEYYSANRHGLFHVDGTPATTRTIGDRQEAIAIVGHILHLMDQSSINITA